MVKLWHVILAVGTLGFISTVIIVEMASRSGQTVTIENFVPVIIIVAISVVGYAIYKIWKSPSRSRGGEENGMVRGGLSMAEAKFITANHLLSGHEIDIFVAGKSPETAKYSTTMIADRGYPSAGEEGWCVRLKLRDRRFFEGLPTKIIIYIDGIGNVTDDVIMNDRTFLDNELWRRPELHYLRGISKTSKARSLSDIVSRHVQETGEFPKDFHPSQLEGYREDKGE